MLRPAVTLLAVTMLTVTLLTVALLPSRPLRAAVASHPPAQGTTTPPATPTAPATRRAATPTPASTPKATASPAATRTAGSATTLAPTATPAAPRTTPPATPRATLRATLRATRPATAAPQLVSDPLAATAPAPAAAATPEQVAPETLAAAVQAYTALGCGGCHTLAAAKAAGVFGPTHEQVAATALQRLADPAYAGAATDAASFLRESILDPEAYVPESYKRVKYRMPPYGYISPAEADLLVLLLLQQE
jgi:hypothetical protein